MTGIAFEEVAATTAGGRAVSLRFSAEEHAARLAATRADLRRRGLDALLIFAQESHYYLTGYDTSGFVFFQAGIVTADDQPTRLLTRRPDLRQAQVASLYDDIRIWLNAEGANPAEDLRAMAEEMGLRGGRIGVEFATHGLTAANGRAVEAAFEGVATLVDGSDIVRSQRLVKSEAELAMIRRAGTLADAATRAAIEASRPGATESDLSAAALTAMLTGGGEVPSGGPLVNTGPRALFGRGMGGARRIEAHDQVLIELAASYCRYHVCTEATVCVGRSDPRQAQMMAVAADALAQIKEAARPGATLGTLDDIHRRVLDTAGFATERFGACGYALGCTFKPTWMDVPPMIYSGNPLKIQAGMVFFVHIMIPDTRTGLMAGLGQTFAIRETGPVEVFSDLPAELFHR